MRVMHRLQRRLIGFGGLGPALLACALLLQGVIGAAAPLRAAAAQAGQPVLLTLCAEHGTDLGAETGVDAGADAPGQVPPSDLPCRDHAHCLLCQFHASPAVLPVVPLLAQPRPFLAAAWVCLPRLSGGGGRAAYAPRGPPIG